MFKSKKKIVDINRPPLVLNYYDDGKLVMSKKDEKLVIDSIKMRKLKEIELLNFSINNLSIQNTIIDKMITDKNQMLETTKRNYIESLNRNINPDLLCQICFENRINLILTPCGHTFCDNCFKSNNSVCFNCRKSVENRYKIYS